LLVPESLAGYHQFHQIAKTVAASSEAPANRIHRRTIQLFHPAAAKRRLVMVKAPSWPVTIAPIDASIDVSNLEVRPGDHRLRRVRDSSSNRGVLRGKKRGNGEEQTKCDEKRLDFHEHL